MRATLKSVNEYLRERVPLRLVKGRGYFFFIDTMSADEFQRSGSPDMPDSIMVCHLRHMDMERWQAKLDLAIEQFTHNIGDPQ